MKWNELKVMMFSGWRDLHGKSRYMLIVLSALLGGAGYLTVVLVREYASYQVYQLFILCFIVLTVLTFGSLWYRKQEEYEK